MSKYGLVFKIANQCHLAEYFAGTADISSVLTNYEDFYDDLTSKQLALVKIKENGDNLLLYWLKTITVEDDENPAKCVADMVAEGKLSAVSQNIYNDEKFELYM